MRSDIYRIAIIGTGFIGKKYIPVFYMNPKLQLQVICDNDRNSAEALRSRYRFKRCETNWQNVVKSEDVDIVCICVPNNAHFKIAAEAAKNGKHIICEKPLGLNGEESASLAQLVKENNVIASCSYNLIHIHAIRYAKGIIESGELGELVCFRGSYDNDRLVDPNVMFEWRMLKENTAGGSLSDLAINTLSMSQYLFGDIKSVCGMTEIIHQKRKDINGNIMEVQNDDIAQFIFQYHSRAMGYISSNRVAPGSKQDMQFEAQLTQGTIKFSLERMNEIQIYRYGDSGFSTIISDENGWFNIGYEDLKTLDTNSFMENLTNGTQIDTDFVFAAKIDTVIDGVLKSAKTKQWVDIKRIP